MRPYPVLTALYVTFALSGATQAVPLPGVLHYFFALAAASLAALWATRDASARGKPLLHIVTLLVFLFWPVALPICAIVGRGWRGLALSGAHAVGLIVVQMIAFWIGLAVFSGGVPAPAAAS